MKKITLACLAVIAIVVVTALQVSAQSEEMRKVSGFTGICVTGEMTMHVIIKTDTTEGIKIVTTPDVMSVIETFVKDGILTVKFKDSLQNGQGETDSHAYIYVGAKSLSTLIKNGAGFVTVKGSLTGNDVKVILTGAGVIQSQVNSENLQAAIDGPGTIKLNGTATTEKATITGPGRLAGHDLKTEYATAVIDGEGSVYLNADKTVSGEISGAGQIFYAGNATIIENKTSGTDRIKKID